MASVGELSVDVKARINDFSKNLNQAIGQANTFATRMSQVGKKDYFAPVQETLSGMKRDFGQIIQGIVLAQTFYSGLQLFKQLTAAVYEYTDALNYARVTFSNLFRDASLGEEFVAVLQQYAARSPFDFTDIEKGARQLSAYGVQAKNLMYVMEGIGNLSAVTGDPQTFETVSRAMGQIYSKGRLSAEEMRQLAEAGLNVKEVYARLGVEAGNVGKANVDAATALNTIVEVLNDTYAGAMDAANTTMRGMLANTKDVLLSVTSAVFQPTYEKLQRVLKWIQIGLDDFQKAFSTEGLTAAIEKVFGAEALNRIQQFLAICQYLGNILYQVLAPAFRIVGMYGQSFLTVFGTLVRVLGPVVELFAALLNSFLSTATGARLLQSALMSLVVIKLVGGLASLLTNSFALMSKALAGVISVASAAAGALTILTGAEVGAANGAYGAAAAWKYFTKTLNVNPIVMALTIILSLIAAVAGLRAMLGQTTDALADMSGVDFKKFFEGIKQATGDAEKFKKPFEDAGDAVDDANGELDKTKKKLEGLLSFDEVFKLPERNDTDPTGNNDALSDDIFDPGDWGAIELPEVEPLDPRDLFPDINGILDWFKDQPWWKIGQYIANGVASGLKMAKKVPTKAVADFIEDLLKTAGKELDKFNIKDSIIRLAEKAKESRAAFKESGKLLGDAAYEALERELGPEKAKKMKLKERIEKITKEALKGEKAWKETGQKLAQALEQDLARELGPWRASRFNIAQQMENLAEEAGKAEARFALAGEKLAKGMIKRIEKYLGPEATKELKIAENLERIAKEATIGGKAWEDEGRAAAREWLDGLNKEFASASIKGKAPEKAMITLAQELKAAGVTVTDAGIELSDEFLRELEKGFGNQKSFGEIAKEFGKNFVNAFKTLPANISEELSKSFTPKAMFAGIQKSFTTEGGESIFKAFTGAIKNAVTPAKIGEFLKTGLKDMGITIIGEMLFDELANWLDNNGMHEASVVMGKVGPILASGLGTAIATKSPWGFVVGAIWGALFEDLGKGIENGNWGSFVGQAAGSLGAVLAKIAPRLGAASAGGPAGWIGAIGSMVSDLIFGSIIQNLRDSGDTQTADILDSIDGAVGGALGGAGLGATIGSIFPGIGTAIGAIAGAIIGALAGFLTDNWGAVSEWWTTTAVPWLQDIPNKIRSFFSNAGTWLQERGGEIVRGIQIGAQQAWATVTNFFTVDIPNAVAGFLTGADQWLSDPTKNPLAGVWNGIKEVWGSISTFFEGIYEAILGFFTDDGTLLHDAGYKIMDGLWGGIQGVWHTISEWFLALPRHLLAFFTGDESWLTADGGQIIQGILNGITNWWTTSVVPWFQNLPTNIGNFFSNAINWLVTAGSNIISGLKTGIINGWNTVVTWFQNLPTNISNFFRNAINWLVTAGGNIISGLMTGITNWWNNVVAWLQGMPQRIMNFFSNAGNWLLNAGKNILTGFWNGLQQKWRDVQDFFSGIGDWIVQHKGPESYDRILLVNAGQWIMQGLYNGLNNGIPNLSNLVGNIGPSIQNMFRNASTMLSTAGHNIAIGLYNGIVNQVSGIYNLIGNVRNSISNAFSGSGNLLSTAGHNIMIGLHNGLVESFHYVRDFIWSVGDWIAQNKGPESYDLKLLRPNGGWIMQGLSAGMQEQFNDVLRQVQSFGPQIQTAFQTPQLSVGRTDAPTITQAPAIQYGSQETQEVANPYLTQTDDASQRPIMYVGTLIADKQGLRELKKKLDVVEKEQNRYR